MPCLRYAELVRKPMDVLEMTSLTPNEFQILAPPFEAAFQVHMAKRRLDCKPRTARHYTTYTNCPLASAGKAAIVARTKAIASKPSC